MGFYESVYVKGECGGAEEVKGFASGDETGAEGGVRAQILDDYLC